MVFDHIDRIVYGCISNRCDQSLITKHAEVLGYKPVLFHAYSNSGAPIYHTNVMMSIHTTTAIICLEAISNPEERTAIIQNLERSGHQIIPISIAQLSAFCGNTLELRNQLNQPVLVASQTAINAFSQTDLRQLGKDKQLLPISVPTIEQVGGGSIRCMMAELFLPSR